MKHLAPFLLLVVVSTLGVTLLKEFPHTHMYGAVTTLFTTLEAPEVSERGVTDSGFSYADIALDLEPSVTGTLNLFCTPPLMTESVDFSHLLDSRLGRSLAQARITSEHYGGGTYQCFFKVENQDVSKSSPDASTLYSPKVSFALAKNLNDTSRVSSVTSLSLSSETLLRTPHYVSYKITAHYTENGSPLEGAMIDVFSKGQGVVSISTSCKEDAACPAIYEFKNIHPTPVTLLFSRNGTSRAIELAGTRD